MPGLLRLEVAENSVSSKPTDNLDVPPPPYGTQYVCADNNGLAISEDATRSVEHRLCRRRQQRRILPAGGNLSQVRFPSWDFNSS